MKSIKTKILTSIILMAVIPSLTLGAASTLTTFQSTMELAESTLTEITATQANRISYQLESYINVAETAGTNPYFSDTDVSPENKRTVLTRLAEAQGFERGNIIGPDGLSIFDGQDFSEREYYRAAMRGETYVSDPLLSKITNEYAIIVAAPLWENGVEGSSVAGCIYFAPPASFLIDIMNSVKPGNDAMVYMINPNGTVIADKDPETVKAQTSLIELAKTDESVRILADIHSRIVEGNTGFERFNMNQGERFIAYAPIDADVSGWHLVIEEPISNYFSSALHTIILILILTVSFCIIAVIIAAVISNGIVRPVKACSERIRKLSEGDLTSPAVKTNSKDEVGVLSHSTSVLVGTLNRIISDIERILSAIAKGKLNVDSTINSETYVGDLSSILFSIDMIKKDLTSAVMKIDDSAAQVSAGSDQVSCAAQSLSQGTTEQAASIEQLAATMNNVASQTQNNLEECRAAKDAVNSSAALMQDANDQMQKMTEAMSRISSTSDKIEKIIKTIEDIAFQTNILALNAAVEAAKVGAAGKGFAVVADEVGNLAAKSQDAAKSTSMLIRESSDAVREGIEIADETAATLNKVVESANKVITIVNKVADSSNTQVDAIQQVTDGIDQISTVIQTNSATAEESAAASQELNSQAVLLRNLVEHFSIGKK